MEPEPTRIVIAAGGTAGHVVPALAVAAALRAEGAQVTFIGGERAEAALVPAAGFTLLPIAVEGLSRTNPLRAGRAVIRAAVAMVRARRLLRELDPAAVMGGGGYVAGPVGLAAASLRVPLVLTEADSHMGLSNRALAPLARRVCLAFADAVPAHRRASGRYLVTGRPIPAAQGDRVGARARLGLTCGQRCVVVFGGSLGARSINEAAMRGLSSGRWRVLHIAGRRDYAQLARRARPDGYDLREYLDVQEFADALAAADLVVSRSGGSVFELAAHGCPAILVPYPHAAGDHQSANARWMADAGAALIICDAELTAERLADEVAALLGDPARLRAMGAASAVLARPDAARVVAAELLAAARS